MFRSPRAFSALAPLLVLSPAVAAAQTAGAPRASSSQDAVRFRLPTLTITAQKEAEDPQKLPVSVTAVPNDTIDTAAIHVVSDAAIFAPNALDTHYIPVAFPYPNFAPSGFMGEMGAPRTISVRTGVKF
jgi:outer membrane receptor protein involved in Fe transport